MHEARLRPGLRVRLPGVDAVALVGVAVGYGLWMKFAAGFVVLPLAILLPFVLRELGMVGDDERVREAWRRAGFWAFALTLALAFLAAVDWWLRGPHQHGITASVGAIALVEFLRGPVLLFMVVYVFEIHGVRRGARLVLLVLAALLAIAEGTDQIAILRAAGAEFLQVSWHSMVGAVGLALLGLLAARRPRLAGGWLLVLLAFSAVLFVWLQLPLVSAQRVPTPGVGVPVVPDVWSMVVVPRVSTDLALLLMAVLMMRARREDEA